MHGRGVAGPTIAGPPVVGQTATATDDGAAPGMSPRLRARRERRVTTYDTARLSSRSTARTPADPHTTAGAPPAMIACIPEDA
ncbi:hypothetical protein CMsap09_05510 [Clavibacter michiganensis]|uniref:Uncharacterized protein n=1 Tax=Clavibacter michiganensis TaxID=28447 RepID=A0A251XS95_9MICO|nr:hypothetical protein CMsap09_05510 [Clavibacter michiganensis]